MITLEDVRDIIWIAFDETSEGYNGEYCECRHRDHMEEFISTVLSEFYAMRKRERKSQ